MEYDLSILIPARNEEFLKYTIEDILRNIRGNTEIIVALDGYWPNPVLHDHPRVTLIHFSKSIGQRASINACARLSRAKYVAKCDAHCAFDEGFDVKLMNDMKDNYTMVPVMRNLHVFDWVCGKCGNRTYQGPTPKSCSKCDNTDDFFKDIVWISKTNPQSDSYCFDTEPHFQYFREWRNSSIYKEQLKTGLTETMSLQGSFFMCTRENYWKWNLCDESAGSWGNQGIEVALSTWLNGGRCIVSHKTWYAHLFRTQGDFSFPYALSGKEVEKTKKYIKEKLFNKYIVWLIRYFSPVPGWTEEKIQELEKTEPKHS